MSFHNDFLITQLSVTWFSMRFMLLVTSKRSDYGTKPQRSSLLQCYRSCRYKGLEKGLAGRASKSKSKSESLEPKSKSSKNWLKSGLESKSGLEYYKSDNYRLKGRLLTFLFGGTWLLPLHTPWPQLFCLWSRNKGGLRKPLCFGCVQRYHQGKSIKHQ